MKFKLLIFALLVSGLSLLLMSRQRSTLTSQEGAAAAKKFSSAAASSIMSSSASAAARIAPADNSHPAEENKASGLPEKIAGLKERIRQEDVINRLNGRSLAPELRRQYLDWIDELTKAETEQINQELARLEIEIHAKQKNN